VAVKTEQGVRELPNDFVFVFAGGEPPFELLKKAGVKFGGGKSADPASARPAGRPRP
jgi:hypothetical protein